MAETPLTPETAAGGQELAVALVALPSWPLTGLPQHLTEPSDTSAQADSSPIAIAVTPLSPEMAMGVEEYTVVVPGPSTPPKLLPQQSTEPPDRSAHVTPL